MNQQIRADMEHLLDLEGEDARRVFAATLIREEFIRSQSYPAIHSAHEGWAVLKEEVDELWDEVKVNQKTRDLPKMVHEAVQCAAMAMRFLVDVCRPDVARR